MISIDDLRRLDLRSICLGSHPGTIQSILDYEYMCGFTKPSIGYIVANNRKQERYFWGENEFIIPVISSIDKLASKEKQKLNTVLNFQSGRRILSNMEEALSELPELKAGFIFAEQVPEAHSIELIRLLNGKDILIAGPASVGILVPGSFKVGAIGGTQYLQIAAAKITQPGNHAVISTSGGMVNELIHAVTGAGRGVSFAIALGGDRYPITSPADAFLLAEEDKATTHIVYFGELGGTDEYEIASLLESGKISKPVIAYIAGTVADLFEVPPQFGHAKAMAQSKDETANAKKEVLRQKGAKVVETFSEFNSEISKSGRELELKPAKEIGERKKHIIVSRLSGEKDGEAQLLGKSLIDQAEKMSYAGLVLSMLLGHQVSSEKIVNFTDMVLRLLVDHGPYVAGASNVITTARAGKDLASGLATGILTIGPRFGGAINGAADAWLTGVANNDTGRDFVGAYKQYGGIIPGVGHKKYRIDLPDPRIKLLRQFAPTQPVYLNFALEVEKVTTAKKGNLILNVDGAIAAIMLDLLNSELHYDYDKLRELVEIEFFNALFVLSRSVGFAAHYLDQRRHDEGLLRLTDNEVLYYPNKVISE